jgi:hypothetical protein
MSKIVQAEKMYKVGFYDKTGERVAQDYLKPMTHKQACTFKSKMMNPDNHFLYEVVHKTANAEI